MAGWKAVMKAETTADQRAETTAVQRDAQKVHLFHREHILLEMINILQVIEREVIKAIQYLLDG